MIAIDTNVLVRYLAQDDPRQAKAATTFIEQHLTVRAPGFVSTVGLCEIIWVLEDLYDVKRERLVEIIEGLLASRQLVVDDAGAVRAALKHRQCDLADAIIHEIGQARRCERTVTFDRKFARLENVELLCG